MWNNVTRLELEISSLCNAACPQCARHPTASDFINPILSDKIQWTIDQVQQYLPKEDLVNIQSYLFNGNFGDFIANIQALEVINYFHDCSKNASFHINTNGSARTVQWWKDLAKISNLKISFAIDGLRDTHHLYRRNTSFDQIIKNAKAFIDAGGKAEWVMTVFDHNEHQVDECRTLSEQLGFFNFYPRYSYRGISLVSNKGIPLYMISQSKKLGLPNVMRTPMTIEKILKQEKDLLEKNQQNKPINTKKYIPLTSLSECESFTNNSIFITADWFVVPCCYMGYLSFDNNTHWAYDDFITKLQDQGLEYSSFFAQGNKKVRDIVNFSWIYRNALTDNALNICSRNCNKSTSVWKIAKGQHKDFDK